MTLNLDPTVVLFLIFLLLPISLSLNVIFFVLYVKKDSPSHNESPKQQPLIEDAFKNRRNGDYDSHEARAILMRKNKNK